MMLDKLNEAAHLLRKIAHNPLLIAIDQGQSLATTIRASEVIYFTLREGRVIACLENSHEIEARPSETLVSIAEQLKNHPQFVRTHNAYLVNLDHVDQVSRLGAGEYQLTLFNGLKLPLLQGLSVVMEYFSLKSLDHVVPWNERLAIIIRENLRDFPDDLRMMETDDLRREFSDGTGQLVVTQLIGNVVWQAYNWIKSGKISPIDGNIRSFWYSHIKPILGRLLPEIGENHYKLMIGVFVELVGDSHLFKYADFGFIDDNDALRFIGVKHPQIIIFAEKRGHWRTLQKIQAQTGATVISLGGQPSLMTTEYFVAELSRTVDLDQEFHLISDVDYDPSGLIIAESFRDQLRQMGIERTTLTHIIKPVHFEPQEIKFFKYPVKNESPSDKSKVRQWLDPDRRRYPERELGGIVDENGVRQPWGLESDAMPKDRLIQKAAEAVQKILNPQVRAVSELGGLPYPIQ